MVPSAEAQKLRLQIQDIYKYNEQVVLAYMHQLLIHITSRHNSNIHMNKERYREIKKLLQTASVNNDNGKLMFTLDTECFQMK